jgi:hypothetical protein
MPIPQFQVQNIPVLLYVCHWNVSIESFHCGWGCTCAFGFELFDVGQGNARRSAMFESAQWCGGIDKGYDRRNSPADEQGHDLVLPSR